MAGGIALGACISYDSDEEEAAPAMPQPIAAEPAAAAAVTPAPEAVSEPREASPSPLPEPRAETAAVAGVSALEKAPVPDDAAPVGEEEGTPAGEDVVGAEWMQCHDAANNAFYYTHLTSGESAWEVAGASFLALSWEQRLDEQANTYYFNTVSQMSQWEVPQEGFLPSGAEPPASPQPAQYTLLEAQAATEAAAEDRTPEAAAATPLAEGETEPGAGVSEEPASTEAIDEAPMMMFNPAQGVTPEVLAPPKPVAAAVDDKVSAKRKEMEDKKAERKRLMEEKRTKVTPRSCLAPSPPL